jgi:hypothetical protein
MLVRIDVLNQQFAIVRGHLAIVLSRNGIGGAFSALLEHFGFLPENRRF